jgi:organic hydroperoxide reductase OsmC/OhrA
VFRGDGSRYNPEELLVASLSACHMLWVLHLAADAGIVITDYRDEAEGEMDDQFRLVTLRPQMMITDETRIAEAEAIHHRAHELCFIARSVNFPVRCEPRIHLWRK